MISRIATTVITVVTSCACFVPGSWGRQEAPGATASQPMRQELPGVIASPPRQQAASGVVINRRELSYGEVAQLMRIIGQQIVQGRYWYDPYCGAWGVEGGPTAGFTVAGIDMGAALPANASAGSTGVFVNGRELHPLDVAALQSIFGVVYQGRYWLDAQGNVGVEGGAFLFNLVAASGRSGSGLQGAGESWSHYNGYTGAGVGGDSSGFSYFIDGDSSWTNW
jgi:hypothetical protein